MTVRGEGRRPTREHCVTLGADFGVKPREADVILNEVNDAIARWSEFADQSSCSRKATSRIAESLSLL